MSEPTLDELLADSPQRLIDYLGSVAVPEIPLTLALYDEGDETEGEPAEVVGWVFVLPGHGPLILKATDPRQMVRPRDLESVENRWSWLLGGNLIAVTAA
ncbi:MAG: hypothetical protein WCA46_16215 [Actinocatenispora sp.]